MLRLSPESDGDKCRVDVEGLEIPGHPNATAHFLNHLRELVKRDDYKANLPPWAIFRISPDKFRDYRVAWQEIAKHFEACYLPVKTRINLCGVNQEVLLVPNMKVYFIVEPNLTKALKLLIYLNSDVARSLLKLWALSLRGGFYEHQSISVAQLPLPRGLLECEAWSWVDEELSKRSEEDINEFAAKLTRELADALGISEGECEAITEYGRWLNEVGEVAPSKARSCSRLTQRMREQGED